MILTTQTDRRLELRAEFDKVETILAAAPVIDKFFSILTAEFVDGTATLVELFSWQQ